jgi:acyl carrier protein
MWRLASRAVRSFSYTNAEVQTKVFDVLKKFDNIDVAKINENATFEELGLDSLDSVELVVALEDMLNVDLPEAEALAISSVPQAVETLLKHQK